MPSSDLWKYDKEPLEKPISRASETATPEGYGEDIHEFSRLDTVTGTTSRTLALECRDTIKC